MLSEGFRGEDLVGCGENSRGRFLTLLGAIRCWEMRDDGLSSERIYSHSSIDRQECGDETQHKRRSFAISNCG
jgi:hypothetical protein